VRQYKNTPLQKMSYHFMLHKVNDKVVDVSVGAGQGTKVYNNAGKRKWKIKRHFGAARYFGKRWTDSLYMLDAGDHAEFTLRRIALTIPQRWTIHRTHTTGGAPGTAGYKDYDKTRVYWIKGHRGKYNVFANPEDCKEWSHASKKKRHAIKHKLLAYIRKGKDPEDGHDSHKIIIKEGVDSALILSMLQVFRWEHFVGVAITLMPATQWRSGYQHDDGIIPYDSTGKNPVMLKHQEKGNRNQGHITHDDSETGTGDDALLELDETEEGSEQLDEELESDEALDDLEDDGLDDSELAEYFEEGFVDDFEDDADE